MAETKFVAEHIEATKMEVEIICKGFIKPSSPTPSHLRTYKISLLDQFSSPVYFSFALFYPTSQTDLLLPTSDHHIHLIRNRSFALKHSLSETLSRFYPLAGKIKDRLSIDCDDGGAYYTEAKANIPLAEFLRRSDLTLLNKLVPDVSSFNDNPIGANVSLIQETIFSCGGLGIGLSFSHTAVDGVSLASFIKAWATTAFSAGKQIANPDLDSPLRFPQHDGFTAESSLGTAWMPFMKKERLAVRRLLFDSSSITELKKKAATSTDLENPSRVEVVSALITKRLMSAFNSKSGTKKPMAINHNVNMRSKANPPLPNCSIGNFIWIAYAICDSTETESELMSNIVKQLRTAIRKIDGDFVKEIGYLRLCEVVKEMRIAMANDVEFMIFSSWCNFGLYDCDFGWGKPVWMAHCSLIDSRELTFMNMAYLNDTANGNEVEVWLYVPHDVAAILESDSELLRYVSVNPSPLKFEKKKPC